MKRIPLYLQILIGLVVGVVIGFVAIAAGGEAVVNDWIRPFGNLFIKALVLVAVGTNYHMTPQVFLAPEDQKLDKRDPLVVALKEWIDKEYEDGRVSSMSDMELETKIEELSGGRFNRL